MSTAVIALGSNLGDRAGNLRAALRELRERGVEVVRVSSFWETPPVPADQPAFYNAVAVGETSLDPRELLALLKEIERLLGRRPERRWGPRPVDLDLLLHGETTLATPELELPHPRLAERSFVLAPLAEVWRGPLPVIGKRPLDLLHALDDAGAPRRLGA